MGDQRAGKSSATDAGYLVAFPCAVAGLFGLVLVYTHQVVAWMAANPKVYGDVACEQREKKVTQPKAVIESRGQSASQPRAVLSQEAVTIRLPSGLNGTASPQSRNTVGIKLRIGTQD